MSRADPDVVGVFFALGNETRIELLRRLGTEPLSATALAERAPLTRQAIAKHLRVLGDAGLLKQEKRGREVVYALEPGTLDEARAFLDAVSASWDQAIDRLRRLVEEPKRPARKRKAR